MLRTKWQSRVLAKQQAFLANLCASGDFGRVLYEGGREKSCTLVHTLLGLGKNNMGERLCFLADAHICAGGLFYTCFYSLPKGPSIHYTANNM